MFRYTSPSKLRRETLRNIALALIRESKYDVHQLDAAAERLIEKQKSRIAEIESMSDDEFRKAILSSPNPFAVLSKSYYISQYRKNISLIEEALEQVKYMVRLMKSRDPLLRKSFENRLRQDYTGRLRDARDAYSRLAESF